MQPAFYLHSSGQKYGIKVLAGLVSSLGFRGRMYSMLLSELLMVATILMFFGLHNFLVPVSASVTTWCPPPVSRFSASSPFLHGYRLYWWIKAHLPPILVAHMAENLLAMQETWVGKIPWRREWLPTPAGPGEFDGQRHLEGYSPWSRRVGHD